MSLPSRSRITSRILALAMALLISNLVAHGQCMEWSPVFDPQHDANNRIQELAVLDDGTGMALFVGGDQFGVGGVPAHRVSKFQNGIWSGLGYGTNDTVLSFESYDSGGGPRLYVGGQFTIVDFTGPVQLQKTALGIAVWNGAAWSALTPQLNFPPSGEVAALEVFDDGSGSKLYVGGYILGAGAITSRGILRWNGTSWSGVGGGITSTSGSIVALRSFDDGTGPALYASGIFSSIGGVPAINLARWNGTSWQAADAGMNGNAAWDFEVFDDGGGGALYAGSSQSGVLRWSGSSWIPLDPTSFATIYALEVFDEGSGPALYAGGQFVIMGGVVYKGIVKWNGSAWHALGAGLDVSMGSMDVQGLAVWDDGQGGGSDLMVGGAFIYAGSHWSRDIAAWRGCAVPIDGFCSGDGSLRDCPCASNAAAGFGCPSSVSPNGGQLMVSGFPDPDTAMLQAGWLPNGSSALFVKGDAADSAGILYGDGLRCVDGALVRLGACTVVAGVAQYPDPGGPLLSVRGGTPVGSGLVGYYQTVYRNAANFCTPATFNITNGVRIVW